MLEVSLFKKKKKLLLIVSFRGDFWVKRCGQKVTVSTLFKIVGSRS